MCSCLSLSVCVSRYGVFGGDLEVCGSRSSVAKAT